MSSVDRVDNDKKSASFVSFTEKDCSICHILLKKVNNQVEHLGQIATFVADIW